MRSEIESGRTKDVLNGWSVIRRVELSMVS